MKLVRLVLDFISSLFKSKSYKASSHNESKEKSKPEYSFRYLEDVPDPATIDGKTVYVIGENGNYWVVGFRCPCGCGDFVQLNLLPGGRHVWRLYIHKDSISIYPSIDRHLSCKSHFNLTKGHVVWWTIDQQKE